MWDMVSRSRVWAGRTDVQKMGRLRKKAGEIMQRVIDRMKRDEMC